MKLLNQFDCDEPPPPAEMSGVTVFHTCMDDSWVWMMFQEVVEVNPETVVFDDPER